MSTNIIHAKCFNCINISAKNWHNPVFYCKLDKNTLTYDQVNNYCCIDFKSDKK